METLFFSAKKKSKLNDSYIFTKNNVGEFEFK